MKTEFMGSSIGIRRYQAGDIPLHFAAIRESIKELSQCLAWCHANYSQEDSARHFSSQEAAWEAGQEFHFVIYDPKDGGLVGAVGLNQLNSANRLANLGYWVRTGKTRQSIASSAVRLVARFGFEELQLMRLEIVVAVGNLASHRVAEKSGAVREGVLRNRLALHGQQLDATMHSLTPADLSA